MSAPGSSSMRASRRRYRRNVRVAAASFRAAVARDCPPACPSARKLRIMARSREAGRRSRFLTPATAAAWSRSCVEIALVRAHRVGRQVPVQPEELQERLELDRSRCGPAGHRPRPANRRSPLRPAPQAPDRPSPVLRAILLFGGRRKRLHDAEGDVRRLVVRRVGVRDVVRQRADGRRPRRRAGGFAPRHRRGVQAGEQTRGGRLHVALRRRTSARRKRATAAAAPATFRPAPSAR